MIVKRFFNLAATKPQTSLEFSEFIYIIIGLNISMHRTTTVSGTLG